MIGKGWIPHNRAVYIELNSYLFAPFCRCQGLLQSSGIPNSLAHTNFDKFYLE